MKFSYAIGNPPYNMTKSNDSNSAAMNVSIWPAFIRESTKLANTVLMIHPGGWATGEASERSIKADLVTNYHLKTFKYYSNSNDIFSNVNIDGGISITEFDSTYNKEPTYYVDDEYKGIFDKNAIMFSNKYFEETFFKVFCKINGIKYQTTNQNINENNMLKYVKGSIGSGVGNNIFGFSKDKNGDKVKESSAGMKNPVKCWANLSQEMRKGKFSWYYIELDDLLDYPDYLFSSRKVMITAVGNGIYGGKGNVINNLPQICDAKSTGSGILWIFPKNNNDRELNLIKSLFMTKTARYLMSIKQKGRFVNGFDCVPDYLELAKLLPEDALFTDEWFYKTFNFSEGLINEIETRVSPKVEK